MNKLLKIGIFFISFVCLIISIVLFYNMGLYVDAHNTSPDIVCGGYFWLIMNWLRLGFLAALCILSGVSIFADKM